MLISHLCDSRAVHRRARVLTAIRSARCCADSWQCISQRAPCSASSQAGHGYAGCARRPGLHRPAHRGVPCWAPNGHVQVCACTGHTYALTGIATRHRTHPRCHRQRGSRARGAHTVWRTAGLLLCRDAAIGGCCRKRLLASVSIPVYICVCIHLCVQFPARWHIRS